MPSQTPRGLPYPLPTDPVSHGADDIRRLAEAVDALRAELAYTEHVAAVNLSGNDESTGANIVLGPAIALDGSPVLLEYFAPLIVTEAGSGARVSLCFLMDNASIGIAAQIRNETSVQAEKPVTIRRRFTPPAGSHAFGVRGWSSGGVPGVVYAGAGGSGAYMPGFLRVSRL